MLAPWWYVAGHIASPNRGRATWPFKGKRTLILGRLQTIRRCFYILLYGGHRVQGVKVRPDPPVFREPECW